MAIPVTRTDGDSVRRLPCLLRLCIPSWPFTNSPPPQSPSVTRDYDNHVMLRYNGTKAIIPDTLSRHSQTNFQLTAEFHYYRGLATPTLWYQERTTCVCTRC